MDQNITPGVFNRKTAKKHEQGHADRNGSEGPIKIISKKSPIPVLSKGTNCDGDGRNESEGINNEIGSRFGTARGSGWIGSSSSAFSKSNDPNRRNHAMAQDMLQKLQKEAAAIASHHKPSSVARMRNTSVEDSAASAGVRYKFVTKLKTDDEIKNEKQRKWKEKMKVAQERRQEERRTLDGDVSRAGTDGNALLSCVLDNVEQTNLFKQFTRCGEPVDEDSMYEAWSGEESSATTSEEEDSAALRDGKPVGPQLPSDSSGQFLMKKSGEPNVQEEMASLPATKEKPEKVDFPGKKKSSPSKEKKDLKGEKSAAIHIKPKTVLEPQEKADTINTMEVNAKKDPHDLYAVSPSSIQPAHRASQSRHSASTMTTQPATHKKERSFIDDFIEDLTAMGESMLWHKETAVMNPATVRICLKKGYRCMDGTFCAPRLVWSDDSKGQKYGVDLFDILSLTKADTLELENFPYAMPGRTVCLKIVNGGSFILEARSEEDAFRFVRGIRWVVSRLAFNLVIGNVDVSCELLDLGLVDSPAVARPSCMVELDWSRAMDDVADHLVQKTLAAAMI
ncbi:hypothetical protein IV203_008037 [Nitzschia inconspicua]|uniref:Uncharacterized protein n=1 Tax=Nitzschia inconspicua TaxID=303405 RepID=A0A9K3PP16_9STRA|nr:hypothetical protein IV203_008037 [Nitzschia inconspicua]